MHRRGAHEPPAGEGGGLSTGSWLKMSTGLRDHPKVVRMAGMLKADCLRVVGGLHAAWSVFDEHSLDGLLEFYTLSTMDEKVGWRGFSKAMQAVGWLIESESGLQVPDYEEHNGPTAKRRALDQKRKKTGREEDAGYGGSRNKSGQKSASDTGHMSALKADKKQTREEEEKRREEYSDEGRNNSTVITPAGDVCRALKASGIPPTNLNPSHPTLQVLLEAGATAQEFVDAAPSAIGKRDPFTYLLSVVQRRREDAKAAAGSLHQGPLPKAAITVESDAAERTQQWLREHSREFTPEEKAAADKARRLAIAAVKGISA